jgi:ubiquinone/menaquinone biosynthesis C-methylase UbiE
MTIYDTIGTAYNITRKADPYIAHKMFDLLSPVQGGLYLDIGCGTGNYLKALSAMGAHFYGIDPSEVMLEKASQQNPTATFIQAKAEQIPLADNFFDGAMAMFTLHHWDNILHGLKEINRVLKPGSKLAIMSFTPEQMKGYWLSHYFPKMIEKCMAQLPGLDAMNDLLVQGGFTEVIVENYFVQPDLEDHFMYSNKYKPEMYLHPEIRANISGFSTFAVPTEIENGLATLKQDIESGTINTIMKQYENDLGDYLFLVAEKS